MAWETPTDPGSGGFVDDSDWATLVNDLKELHGDNGTIVLVPTGELAGITGSGNGHLVIDNPGSTAGDYVVLLFEKNDISIAAIGAQYAVDGAHLLFGVSGTYADGITIIPLEITPGGAVKVNGMRAHRHPYSNDRHIESGSTTVTRGSSAVAVTFTDVFASAPVVAIGSSTNEVAYHDSVSSTGLTVAMMNTQGSGDANVDWIAEGAD